MIRRGTWVALALAALCSIGIAFGGPRLLRWIAFFRVRQVEVVGLTYLDQSDVVRRLHLRAQASTFDPLGPTRTAAATIPGVLTATVERRLPGTIRVTIREAKPVGLMSDKDHLVLVDAGGRILPFDPTRAPASLPIVDHDSSAAALLGRLMMADPQWYGAIESARIEAGDVVNAEAESHRVRLRPDADLDILRAVSAVRGYLENEGTTWREIDARYHSRVFVRKAPL